MISLSLIRRRTATRVLSGAISGALALFASSAFAAVTQPDGTVMPLPNPTDEVGLQELFDFKEGVGVMNSVADASTEPATFKPLCDFTAQLLLHETGNRTAYVGWYNSPATDVAPTTTCDETTGMSSGGGPCSENDIFVLIKGDVTEPPTYKVNDPLNHPGKIFTGADIAASPYAAARVARWANATPKPGTASTTAAPARRATKASTAAKVTASTIAKTFSAPATPSALWACAGRRDPSSPAWAALAGLATATDRKIQS